MAQEIIDELIRGIPKAVELLELSFLSSKARKKYREVILERHRSLSLE